MKLSKYRKEESIVAKVSKPKNNGKKLSKAKKETEEKASAFPIAIVNTILRSTQQFSNIDTNHIDQYSTEFECKTKKPDYVLTDDFFTKFLKLAKKLNLIYTMRTEPSKHTVTFSFSERSFV